MLAKDWIHFFEYLETLPKLETGGNKSSFDHVNTLKKLNAKRQDNTFYQNAGFWVTWTVHMNLVALSNWNVFFHKVNL